MANMNRSPLLSLVQGECGSFALMLRMFLLYFLRWSLLALCLRGSFDVLIAIRLGIGVSGDNPMTRPQPCGV